MSRNQMTTNFLKECLADSLIQLMGQKEFSQITINEIAENCNIHRSTWFRHFSCKYDALTFKLVQLWNRWDQAHPISGSYKFSPERADNFFRFIYENRGFISTLLQAHLRVCIYDAFMQIVAPEPCVSVEECYQVQFFLHGAFGLLEEWMKRDFHESPQKMTSLYLQIIRCGYSFSLSEKTDSHSDLS